MLRCCVILIIVLLASCSGGIYCHYPKVKHQAKEKNISENRAEKIVLSQEILPAKGISAPTITISSPTKIDIKSFEIPLSLPKQINAPTHKTAIEGDGRPRDATHYNKNAKIAFVAAIGALAFLGAGLLIHPVFLIGMFLCTLLAFIKGIKAIRKIMKTGEYGRYKAEFALYVAIPLLFLSIVGIIVYLSANGTGLQIGNVFIP